jgi:hypothetical protein
MYRFNSLAHVVDLHTVISTAVDGTSSYQPNTDEPPLGVKMDWQFLISNHKLDPSHPIREEIFHTDQEVQDTT